MMLPNSWHANWSGLKAVVVGLGKSGFSAVDTLVELGVEVVAIGASADPQLIELTEVVGARFIASDSPEVLDEIGISPDFAVVSPGFAPAHPLVQALQDSEVPIFSDLDLAWRLRDKVIGDQLWLGITGTNGKTTTAELAAHMLVTAGVPAVACGNIGNPILDAIRDPAGFQVLVVELSSFQLHYSGEIQFHASAFLNFADDHIDWHGSKESYLAAKSKVFHGTASAIIFNEQDATTLRAAEQAEVQEGCRGIGFSLAIPQPSSVGYVEEILVDRAFLDNRTEAALEIATEEEIAQIAPISDQLRANVAAATALVRSLGIEPAKIAAAIKTFELSPHRNQTVATIDQVRYVNDSKATNPHAADSSLSSYQNILWIVGGLFKGADPGDLVTKHAGRLKAAILIGDDTQLLQERFAQLAPQIPLRVISGDDVMALAVEQARDLASAGDTVLLAPAAASMDQFDSYQDRGNKFIAAVDRLRA